LTGWFISRAEITYKTSPNIIASMKSKAIRNSLSMKGLLPVAAITARKLIMVTGNSGLNILARIGRQRGFIGTHK
jgi:hypothetical protein